VAKPSYETIRYLDKKIIWSGDVLTRNLCMVSWKVMCRPWEAGGLGLKPTRLINESLMLKLAWKLLSEESQWSGLLRNLTSLTGNRSHQ